MSKGRKVTEQEFISAKFLLEKYDTFTVGAILKRDNTTILRIQGAPNWDCYTGRNSLDENKRTDLSILSLVSQNDGDLLQANLEQNPAPEKEKIPKMLTLLEAAKQSGMSYDFLRKQCGLGNLPHKRAGNKIMLNENTLIEFLNN